MINCFLLGSRRFDALNLVNNEQSDKAHATKYTICNAVEVIYEIAYDLSLFAIITNASITTQMVELIICATLRQKL